MDLTVFLANLTEIVASLTAMFTSVMAVFMEPPLVVYVGVSIFSFIVGIVGRYLMRK